MKSSSVPIKIELNKTEAQVNHITCPLQRDAPNELGQTCGALILLAQSHETARENVITAVYKELDNPRSREHTVIHHHFPLFPIHNSAKPPRLLALIITTEQTRKWLREL
jgi:hypothetical protein